MPLEKGAAPGSKGFSRNVATEVAAKKPQAQAVAIAYREARADTLQPSPFAGPAEMRAKKMNVLAYGVDALASRMDALAARADAKSVKTPARERLENTYLRLRDRAESKGNTKAAEFYNAAYSVLTQQNDESRAAEFAAKGKAEEK